MTNDVFVRLEQLKRRKESLFLSKAGSENELDQEHLQIELEVCDEEIEELEESLLAKQLHSGSEVKGGDGV